MTRILVSCEHASRAVPEPFRQSFVDAKVRSLLGTHHAYDLGARPVAERLSALLDAPLWAGTMTRLLVDLNRSPGHRSVLSPFSLRLAPKQQEQLRAAHGHYQASVARFVCEGRGPVLHLAIHSFCPALSPEKVRRTDLGLLYDPSRPGERAFVERCQGLLRRGTGLLVHRNAPYRGVSDGLPTLLRRKFSPRRYYGIEIEINQRLLSPRPLRGFVPHLVALLAECAREHFSNVATTSQKLPLTTKSSTHRGAA